jgi:hypothetical protein
VCEIVHQPLDIHHEMNILELNPTKSSQPLDSQHSWFHRRRIDHDSHRQQYSHSELVDRQLLAPAHQALPLMLDQQPASGMRMQSQMG